MDVLQLDVSGRPQAWMTVKEAAILYACDAVAWTLGDPCHVMRGGVQRATGKQSRIEVHSIIAVRGSIPARGRFCGDELTREHIIPVSRRGLDTWMNCITACRSCNGRKGNRMPEEANMTLMYLPYVPSLHEDMILRGRRILADQMEFLLASVPRSSRLHG
jgi:hypothetical protein